MSDAYGDGGESAVDGDANDEASEVDPEWPKRKRTTTMKRTSTKRWTTAAALANCWRRDACFSLSVDFVCVFKKLFRFRVFLTFRIWKSILYYLFID